MGVVYLAVQESLGREVALKLVRPDQMVLSGARERFLREVQIVARLQHPGVVPIYTFGKANGIAYFAMERVRGASLEQALAALKGRDPGTLEGADLGRALQAAMAEDERGEALADWLYGGTWEQCVLRVFRLAAEALEHVHGRGVLHRDLKPSNIMLTPGGRVMLLDFGLAQGGGTDKLTRSATQLGSVPYLPPELLQGGREAASPRADVYSLGVSLYQALCLRLPYEGPTTTATMLSIAAGAAAAPRSRNSSLSADAETVCLTAMESAVERRYASAEAFARDLSNVLERRPIDARRAGPLQRLVRWSQRHPARATAAALGLLIVLGGPLGWAWQEYRSNIALAAEGARSKRNLTSALQAVDRLFTRVAEAELSRLPHMEGFRRALLEDALAFQKGLLADNTSDDDVRVERARTHARIARLETDLGRGEDALRSLAEGLALLDAAAAQPQRERASAELEALAQLRYDEAEVSLLQGLLAPAAASAAASVDFAARLRAGNPDSFRAALLEVDALRVQGMVAAKQGRTDDAAAAFESALERLEALQPALEQLGEHALSASRVGNEYGMLLLGQATPAAARLEEAENVLRRTIARFDARLQGDVPEQAYAQAVLRNTLAYVCAARERPADSVELLDANEPALLLLVEQNPGNIRYRETLAKLYNNRANFKYMSGRAEEAHGELTKAVETLAELVRRVPGSPELLSTLAVAENNLGGFELASKRPAEARELLESAVEHGGAALALAPDDVLLRERLSQHWFWLYDARRDLGETDAAIEAMRGYAKYGPASWRTPFEVARRMAELAELLDENSPGHAQRIEQLGELAADFLRQARDAGCDQWPNLLEHEKLAALAETAALRALVSATES